MHITDKLFSSMILFISVTPGVSAASTEDPPLRYRSMYPTLTGPPVLSAWSTLPTSSTGAAEMGFSINCAAEGKSLAPWTSRSAPGLMPPRKLGGSPFKMSLSP